MCNWSELREAGAIGGVGGPPRAETRDNKPQNVTSEYACQSAPVCCVEITLYHLVTGERTANTNESGGGKRARITRTQYRESTCSHRLGKRSERRLSE